MSLLSTRQHPTYNPEIELSLRYPDWTLHTGIPGTQTSWLSFQPALKVALVNPDLDDEDRTLAIAMIVALLDMGAIRVGRPVPEQVLTDAQDLAELWLGLPPAFDPTVPHPSAA